ncbi:isocitrate/isopropylmalate family dehydrogenase [Thalassotalea hakodatensis]|uniref:isocitrate/isopropylmalate family dehydrogenase n=1 Tax=Thalassotalea hakodatensis TaxID=3030492 RepID=UPI002573306E|nr:isocitrate/isopropylmalate family dehydrogenase [Thalassotalea hakodatensis]
MTTTQNTPEHGQEITLNTNGSLNVPNAPIIPYIVGDGIGIDITPVMLKVVDAAVAKAYGGDKRIVWLKTYAGVSATEHFNDDIWLPDETVQAFKQYKVGIKGPLDAPIGSGLQSLSIQLREQLKVKHSIFSFQCFDGLPKFINHQQQIDIEVFQGQPSLFSNKELNQQTDDESFTSTIAINRSDVEQLLKKAIEHAVAQDKRSVALIHDGGNTADFTDAICRWGYQLAKTEFDGKVINGGPWVSLINPKTGTEIIIKDISVESMIAQLVLNPAEYQVLVAPFAYGPSLQSLLSTLSNTTGITPACYLSDDAAVFEATHGTAQKYAGLNKVNPSALLLAAVLMLRHMGWHEAADNIVKGIRDAIRAKTVTYDLANKIADSTMLTSSGFGDCIIEHMKITQ